MPSRKVAFSVISHTCSYCIDIEKQFFKTIKNIEIQLFTILVILAVAHNDYYTQILISRTHVLPVIFRSGNWQDKTLHYIPYTKRLTTGQNGAPENKICCLGL